MPHHGAAAGRSALRRAPIPAQQAPHGRLRVRVRAPDLLHELLEGIRRHDAIAGDVGSHAHHEADGAVVEELPLVQQGHRCRDHEVLAILLEPLLPDAALLGHHGVLRRHGVEHVRATQRKAQRARGARRQLLEEHRRDLPGAQQRGEVVEVRLVPGREHGLEGPRDDLRGVAEAEEPEDGHQRLLQGLGLVDLEGRLLREGDGREHEVAVAIHPPRGDEALLSEGVVGHERPAAEAVGEGGGQASQLLRAVSAGADRHHAARAIGHQHARHLGAERVDGVRGQLLPGTA
mmetsp:Transcript_63279/g.177031  ORF Transcript_63279/g.177031 Transcript_63279/m.177031 type:complete len:290 (+) Transcript_63279:1275-2144(+)